MDLNKNMQFSHVSELSKNENFGDTTLRLNFLGYGGSNNARFGTTQNNLHANLSSAPDDGCKLVLGLGPTPSVYLDNYYNIGLNKNQSTAALFTQGVLPEDDSILKLGLSGGIKESMSQLERPLSTQTDVSMPFSNQISAEDSRFSIPVVDEGSTTAKKSGGYMPALLFAPKMDSSKPLVQTQELFQFGDKSQCHQFHESCEPSSHQTDFSVDTLSEQTTIMTSSDNRASSKKCNFVGCSKGARGASGLCIGHGGGQRCQKPGCNKGAESRTAYCKAHGGGRRCHYLGCTKSAEGKTDHCIAHGGGRRCGFPGGCTKAARGKSGLCIRHGGGKSCKVEGCTRSAEGQPGLCISHGGGRRCHFQGCNKGAQGSTTLCKAHGGGKRCIFAGCTKGAEGSTPLCKGHGGGKRCLYNGDGICPKSVHGGTNFCVAHGGGKRCVVPGCTKSARGRTDCCVRHGGGKRCKIENCDKSAQGSTDFCKAHGGEKDAPGWRANARNSQGAGVGYALLIAEWCKSGRQEREGSSHQESSMGLYQQQQPQEAAGTTITRPQGPVLFLMVLVPWTNHPKGNNSYRLLHPLAQASRTPRSPRKEETGTTWTSVAVLATRALTSRFRRGVSTVGVSCPCLVGILRIPLMEFEVKITLTCRNLICSFFRLFLDREKLFIKFGFCQKTWYITYSSI